MRKKKHKNTEIVGEGGSPDSLHHLPASFTSYQNVDHKQTLDFPSLLSIDFSLSKTPSITQTPFYPSPFPTSMAFTQLLLVCVSWLLCVVCVLVYGVDGRFVVEKSSIRVLSPYNLRAERHDSAIGNFGVPDYGGSMVGHVVYPHKASYGCAPFDGDKPFKSKSSRPTILLLDRGGNYTITLL